jgi:KaiC/GvpD/RAD55 family RecA-like ATPase
MRGKVVPSGKMRCIRCGAPYPRSAIVCQMCGQEDAGVIEAGTFVPAPGSAIGTPFRLGDAAPVVPDVRRLRTGDEALDGALGGGLVLGGSYLVWGPPGSGKTTAMLRAIGEHGGLLVTAEMRAAELVRLARARAPKSLERGDALTAEQGAGDLSTVLGVLPKYPRGLLLFDSLQRIGFDPSTTLRTILSACEPQLKREQATLVFLSHATRTAGAKLALEIEHDVTGVVALFHREIVVSKHRHGPTTVCDRPENRPEWEEAEDEEDEEDEEPSKKTRGKNGPKDR